MPIGVILAIGFVAFIIFAIFIGSPFMLWFQALVSGAKVGLLNIIFMRFRKVPPSLIVNAIITSTKIETGRHSKTTSCISGNGT